MGARIIDEQRAEEAALAVVVAAAEHGREHGQLGGVGDAGGDGGGDRADEDVAVLHVHQLVGQHALQLVARQRLQDALGAAHDGVLGVAAGGEGVGLQGGGDGHDGHGQLGPLGQAGHHAVEVGRLLLGDDLGAGGLQGQLVAEPVGAAHQHEADEQADGGAAAASEEAADGDEEPAETGEQDSGLQRVLEHRSFLATGGARVRRQRPCGRRGFRTGTGMRHRPGPGCQ